MKSWEKHSTKIPSVISTDEGLREEVAELNGIVIPAMFEVKSSIDGASTIENYLTDVSSKLNDADAPTILSQFLKDALNTLPNKLTTIPHYLRAGNVYQGIVNELYNKIHQITKYEWLTQEMVDICHLNMSEHIEDDSDFEIPIEYEYVSDVGTLLITGIMDCDDGKTIWEFKCVEKIQLEHKLQLALYAFLWQNTKQSEFGVREFKLMNIRTGEIWSYSLTSAQEKRYLQDIVDLLTFRIFATNEDITDENFIENCQIHQEKYNNT